MKKKIHLIFAALFVLCTTATFFTACGDADDEPNPGESSGQKFHSLEATFIATANPEFLEMVDMSMEVKSGTNSQTFTLGSKGRVRYGESTTVCPATYDVTLHVTRKPGFVPDPDKSYDVKVGFSYSLKATDADGGTLKDVTPLKEETNVLQLEGLDTSQLDAFFNDYLVGEGKIFPATYHFRFYQKDGKYMLEMPKDL